MCGLSWRAMSSVEPSDLKVEVGDAMKRNGSRYAASVKLESGYTLMGFIAPDAPRAARSAVSATAWLAQIVEQPTLVIDRVANGRYWVAMVQPGDVDTETDVLRSEDEIGPYVDELLNRLMRELDMSALRVVVGGHPRSALLDAESVPYERGGLKLLLGHLKPPKSARVVQLAGVTPVVWMALGVVLLAIVIGVAYTLINKRVAAKRELEAARRAAIEREREAVMLATLREKRIDDAVVAALQSDSATVPPAAVVQSCVHAWGVAGTSRGGWPLVSVACQAGRASATASFKRDGGVGQTDYINLVAALEPLELVPSFSSDKTASVGVPVSAGVARDGYTDVSQLTGYSDFLVQFGTWLQRYEQTARVTTQLTEPTIRSASFVDPEKSGSGADARTPVPGHLLYQKGSVRVTGTDVWVLERFGELDIPELTIDSITLTHRGQGVPAWEARATYLVAPH